MDRIPLYVALFGVAVLVGLFSTLYVLRYDSDWPSFAVTELRPRESAPAQLAPRDQSAPATFETR